MLVMLKDRGITLDESVKGVVLWYNRNESTGTDIHDNIKQDSMGLNLNFTLLPSQAFPLMI